MCGICGIYTPDRAAGQPEFEQATRRMMSMMARRGPDMHGSWSDTEGHLQLGFRRLSILDLSTSGNQPMHSHDQRSVLVFNGELYNYRDLRRELEARGITFRSRTDSEVVLEALNHWGPEALQRFNGMFALGWYERATQQLMLARDHAGIKPLYYYAPPDGSGVAFASQFNCLLHTPWGRPGEVRPDVLRLYLRLHHIPAPYGLLEHTYQLQPGHYVLVDSEGRIIDKVWWTLPRNPQPDLAYDEALEALHGALQNAIERQRIADVPLGLLLSGGIDSPLIAAIASQQTDASLEAYTLSIPGWGQDETAAASGYAKHLQVEQRLQPFKGNDILQIARDAFSAQTEPHADYSVLPTLLVSRAARSSLTVALSGDGGDELFWGYERPLSLLRNGRDFRWPWLVRIGLYLAGKYGLSPRRSDVIVSRTPGHYYFEVNSRLKSHWLARLAPQLDALPADFNLYDFGGYKDLQDLANYSRWVEFYGQLQRNLKKVDMASMYHSLEVRVPMLDREVIEVSIRLNPFDAMRSGTRKALLRDLLGRYVPPETIPQQKRGFAVPLGDWLRGDLKPLVEESLLEGELYPAGLWEREEIRTMWQEHLQRKQDHKWALWTLIALQQWFKQHWEATAV